MIDVLRFLPYLDVNQFDFTSIALRVQEPDGTCHQIQFELEEFQSIDMSWILDRSQCISFSIDAMVGDYAWKEVTDVPLAWVNRLVMVKLVHGSITGMLSDLCVDDGVGRKELCLSALPGKPHIPPLPINLVHGIALVPQAFHASSCHDEICEIYKFFVQADTAMAFKEMHFQFGWSLWEKICTLEHPWLDVEEQCAYYHDNYHMEYYKFDDSGKVRSAYLQSTAAVLDHGGSQRGNYKFDWTKPFVSTGPIRFHKGISLNIFDDSESIQSAVAETDVSETDNVVHMLGK